MRGLRSAMRRWARPRRSGTIRGGGHPALRTYRDWLEVVHLKDVQASGGEVNVLLGKGIARIPEVMAELKKINYAGLVAIEYEHDGPVEEDIRIEVEYARKLL